MKIFSSLFRYLGWISLLCFIPLSLNAQDQKVADSLAKLLDGAKGLERMELLRELSFNESNDINLALDYSEELIQLSKQFNNLEYLSRGYLQKGNKERLLGNLEEALSAFVLSAESAIEGGYITGEGAAYMAAADVYSMMENSSNAELYYGKAINLLRTSNDSVTLANALYNVGDHFLKFEQYNRAGEYFEEAGEIFERTNYTIGKAYILGNLGRIYAEKGNDELAKRNINQAISILEPLEDYSGISEFLNCMSDIYSKQNDIPKALEFANQALEIAQRHGLKEQISVANLLLAQLNEQKGNTNEAYQYYKSHIVYRDSVSNVRKVQEMADIRTNFEVSQKQLEVDLLNQQKRTQKIIAIATTIALFLIGLLALGLFRRNAFIQKTKRIIEQEKLRSDQLLRNILPEETAKELKEHGKVTSHRFDSVTVLFTDFVGFTKYSEGLSPEALVETVDFYFSKFDEIIEQYGLEKIKTIGDAYMCVGGLPFEIEDHAKKIVKAAIEIVTFVEEISDNQQTERNFSIRVGIHTGSVVAGVVGSKKFAYDVWGDTVNIAARMETNSEEGKINISASTHNLIQDEFECEYRGEIDVKNKGMMKMYFVKNQHTIKVKEPFKSKAYDNTGS
ncbi:adenylate/guanylate cyclase domain-containing protein [Mangrovimonas sp. YM274]|uniref:adenylate/guanylate cyclase domain-containing protein n=1 Tax=Mangrovimonas sp. YM274 TaxID=3070660 RepID=UPI0027DD9B54|nr:adenylate/guanylate cyclase domain-containing protein [Mangrovimonas sp. YM274]WMI67343.1 adenylate/guanylate cyclase domain-containing protein [Mangrovimonas sp. YM274]